MSESFIVRNFYSPKVYGISPDITIAEALDVCESKQANTLPVIEGDRVIGILSVLDIIRALVPREMRENFRLASSLYSDDFFREVCQSTYSMKVGEVMRKNFRVINPDTNILEIATDLLNATQQLLPVVEDGRIIGVVTKDQVKKLLRSIRNGV